MTNLPAFLQNYKRGAPSESLDSLTKMSLGAQPYVSIMGNRFRAIDAVGDEQMIGDIDRKTGVAFADVVIIDANPHVSKTYYASDYDPKANEYMPPDCWSDNGIAPSTQANKPQCRTCAECPLAVWGSDTSKLTGKQTKACNDVKKIAIYIPELNGMGAFLLRIPPASLKDLANYARTLASNGATVAQVITRMTFKPDGVGMLSFQAVNWISEPIMDAINELDQQKIDLLTGKNDQPRTGELAAPAARQQIAAPQGQGNGTPAPKQPPQGMFSGGGAAKEPEQTATQALRRETPDNEETEVERLKREMAELQAKLAGKDTAPADAPKRTRRTKAEIEADKAAEAAKNGGAAPSGGMFTTSNASTQQAEEKMDVPAFLNGGQAGATTPVVNASRAGGQPADAPSPDLKNALDAAFSLNLQQGN